MSWHVGSGNHCYLRGVSNLPSIPELAKRFQCWLIGWSERNPEGAARIALWAEEQLEKPEEAESLLGLFKTFVDGLMPHNWRSLQVGMHIPTRELMAESGICLAWVPPADVVEAMVHAASKAERDQVILANADAILNSIDTVLSEATHPEIESTTAAAREAAASYRAGHAMAAQSLAAAVLGEVLENHLGFDAFSSARRAFEKEPNADSTLWSFRRVSVQAALHAAILRSEEQSANLGFNRHLSVHGVSDRQFTDAHSLSALMLVAGALRELHEMYRLGERGYACLPGLAQFAREQGRLTSELPPARLSRPRAPLAGPGMA